MFSHKNAHANVTHSLTVEMSYDNFYAFKICNGHHRDAHNAILLQVTCLDETERQIVINLNLTENSLS